MMRPMVDSVRAASGEVSAAEHSEHLETVESSVGGHGYGVECGVFVHRLGFGEAAGKTVVVAHRYGSGLGHHVVIVFVNQQSIAGSHFHSCIAAGSHAIGQTAVEFVGGKHCGVACLEEVAVARKVFLPRGHGFKFEPGGYGTQQAYVGAGFGSEVTLAYPGVEACVE